jgi:hypothetical protein
VVVVVVIMPVVMAMPNDDHNLRVSLRRRINSGKHE